ncbi:glyoxalase [Halobacillus andaensis]|uniref:Glyoxalase n=1 Tax=Halobacillus andaensis TaxID=1176239 RepID=A0A917B4R6_HALAA|nr:VOC family protein [Halobacillus andaensis]MBP2006101.1 catechol 2,3-dioxygenase-like lactoylglutathione lyase family enzyme [Halobacillus andaensis]GGF23646.1 glyoxalase [Halobacillus andaensis]
MYEGIHHVSIIVTDIERAKHFYGEVLGFEESSERPDFGFPGAWYQVGSTQIHLIVHEEGHTLRGTTEIDSRDGHFAIRAKNIEDVIENLRKHNVEFVDKPHNKTEWHQVFISDPDGNLIEFNK